jgi:protein-disulfide isomerase
MLVTFACITALGGYGMFLYHEAKKDARSAVSLRIVKQVRDLPSVGNPSFLSPYWTVRSTEAFEDAPIQLIEFSDFLCPDCLFLTRELDILKQEFAGKINVVFQFFPLEGRCNEVVAEKDIHHGACELAYIAAYDPAKFVSIHDEIFAHFNEARNPEWRQELAVKYGVEGAFDDPVTHDIVRSIVNTGMEYEKTSDQFSYGIRSTPTMIINGRMIIGTLPLEQMRAIFQDLVDEYEGRSRFLEQWVPPKARKVKR